jgi:predicted nucleic acid-binding protein
VVIVDTTVWVDYFQGVENPETDWLNTELDRQRLGLTDIILCEVLQGVRDDVVAKDVERSLLTLVVFETGGVTLAREAARNYRALRSRGHTVRKTIDCLIATFCLRGEHSLLHRDRDFGPFEKFLGLSVIHP